MRHLEYMRLNDKAREPTYGTDGAACFDLYATDTISIGAGSAGTVGTGLCFGIPKGYVMLVYSRSGHGFKNGVRLANCTGVIDSDYTGEVMVRLTNDSDKDFHVNCGDRVAQALLVAAPQLFMWEVKALKTTARGAKGFGSTGL